jgi:hypothetical protein
MHIDCIFQVADELVADFSNLNINIDSPDPDNPCPVKKTLYDSWLVIYQVVKCPF